MFLCMGAYLGSLRSFMDDRKTPMWNGHYSILMPLTACTKVINPGAKLLTMAEGVMIRK